MKEKLKRKSKGITLIALVITIIVLLILAGVSIATLTGENGILTRAREATEKTEEATEEEQRKLAMLEAATNTKNTTFEGITIPAGFAPTRIEGESTVDEGLVMVDSKGNSYVWIEVPKTVDVYPIAGLEITKFTEEDYKNIYDDLKNYTKSYEKGTTVHKDEFSDETAVKDVTGLTATQYNNLKKKMLKSVYENEGFWIGQYEVGIEQKYRIFEEENIVTTEHPIEEIPVIKANTYPYNWVRGYQAQQLASSMNSGNYTSSLMFGVQWDLMCKFIEKNSNLKVEDINADSKSWGNYSNISFDIVKGEYSINNERTYTKVKEYYRKPESTKVLLTTGVTKRNSILNIYDIAGNMWEWTLEPDTVTPTLSCCMRGGGCNNDSGSYPASSRWNTSNSASYDNSGFRTTLF